MVDPKCFLRGFPSLQALPKGITCPRCGGTSPYWISTRKIWRCKACSYELSVTSGTIFHRSRTPLQKWYIAIWLIVNSQKGISAKQLARSLGVTYKTAWRMAMQIRKAMRPGYGFEDSLAGIVEGNDVYIGGPRPGKRGRGAAGKEIVVGFKERGGNVVAEIVQNLKAETLRPLIDAHVSLDADLLVTDELRSDSAAAGGRRHATICHSQTFVGSNVHAMGIESFWSLFKRAIIGVYHRVSAKYLQAYLNEFVFRLNNRHNDDIFEAILGNC